MRRLPLHICFALAFIVSADVYALTAKVVRSEKTEERIPGLTLKTKQPKVKRERGESTTYTTEIRLTFTTKGRSLLKDESPLIIAPNEAALDRQKLKIQVSLSGRVTPVRLMALSPTGLIEEEKLLVVFEGWKGDKTARKAAKAKPEPPEERHAPIVVAKREPPAPREPQAVKPAASEATVPAASAGYRLIAVTRITSASRESVDNVTGGSSSLDLPFNFGVNVNGAVSWKKSIEPTVYLDVMRYGYSPPSFGTSDTSDNVLFNFGAGANYYPFDSRGFLVSFLLGYQQQAIFRARSIGNFTFDTLGMPRVTLGSAIELYDDKKSSLWLDGALYGDFSASNENYTFRHGFGFSARFTGTRLFKKTQLRGSLLYRQETSSTTITDFLQKEYGVELGAAWDF